MSTFVYFPHNFFILKNLSKRVKKFKFSEEFCRFSFFMKQRLSFHLTAQKIHPYFCWLLFYCYKETKRKIIATYEQLWIFKDMFLVYIFPIVTVERPEYLDLFFFLIQFQSFSDKDELNLWVLLSELDHF